MLPGSDFRSDLLSFLQPTSFCCYDKATCLMVTIYKPERNTFEYQQVTGHRKQLSSTFPISSGHWLQKLSIYIAAKEYYFFISNAHISITRAIFLDQSVTSNAVKEVMRR